MPKPLPSKQIANLSDDEVWDLLHRRGVLEEEPEEDGGERLHREAAIDLLIEDLDDDELLRLPGVRSHKKVRGHREDLEAAARGEMVEAEREAAATALSKEEADVRPSEEDVAEMLRPPVLLSPREPNPEEGQDEQ